MRMDDQRLETMIGNLLRAGVLLAAAIVSVGGVFYLFQHGMDRVSYRTFAPDGRELRTLDGIVRAAAHGRSEGWMQLGLVLLIATPVARVSMAVVGFQLERDRMYVMVSLIVLGILIVSLLHAT